MDISGKVAVVTGGGTGIGAAIAEELSKAGARVLIAGRRARRLEETAARIGAEGGQVAYRVTDVGIPSECEGLLKEAERRFGPVDILVNNAAIKCHGRPIESHSVEDWDQVMDINVRAAFLLTCGVLPSMKSRKTGFILMVSSESGMVYYRDQSIYGLSKHCMNALVQFILAEAKDFNIHAVALCPGLTDTEMGLGFSPPAPENCLSAKVVAACARWVISQPDKINVAQPLAVCNMWDPWKTTP